MTGRTRIIVVTVALAALGAALVLSTRQQAAVECTVCMQYEGRDACRTALGPDRGSATVGAIRNACGVLSSGVTGGIRCDRTPPKSVKCTE